jgi:hypothetical protein
MDMELAFKIGEVVILSDSAGSAFAGQSATVICHNWFHKGRRWDYGVRTSRMYRKEIIGFNAHEFEAVTA